ncbi:Plant specific eukaryotic initiation factor 4B, partial [Dillenia turbinata]
MSKAWGGFSWAAEAERADAEEKEQAAAAAAAAAASSDPQSFPSLKEAASTKQKKKTKMSLSEFNLGGYETSSYGRRDSGFEYKGLTPEEMLRLPTGPKERSAEEMQHGRLGGGFSSYGSSSGPPPGRMRDRDDGDGSWGGNRRSYGSGFEEDRRMGPPRALDYDLPSRADEVDNWAIGKKSISSSSLDSGPGRQNRYSSLGGGIGSRADEVDNWAVGKKSLPARSSGFGSGFRDGSGPEPDRWTRGGFREPQPERERSRLVLDPPRGEIGGNETVRVNRPSPFGAARPREEVLAEKGLDWKKLDSEIEAKRTSRPTSSHSSRPSSEQSNRSEGVVQQGIEGVKQRPKVNPFGDARPREVLLEEKGLDWRKIDLDLEHRAIDRPETEKEKSLKEEIDNIKKELERADKEQPQSSGEESNLRDILLLKEKDLELLTRDLNDRVRFGQKAVDRPGSGAGRVATFAERPPSQSGSFEEARSMDFVDRPRSRGTGDAWIRPGEDRRHFKGGFQGGRERGFLGSRDFDR